MNMKFSYYVINVIKIQVAARGCKAPLALLSTSYNVVTSLLKLFKNVIKSIFCMKGKA